jgi:hypothetical protein
MRFGIYSPDNQFIYAVKITASALICDFNDLVDKLYIKNLKWFKTALKSKIQRI